MSRFWNTFDRLDALAGRGLRRLWHWVKPKLPMFVGVGILLWLFHRLALWFGRGFDRLDAIAGRGLRRLWHWVKPKLPMFVGVGILLWLFHRLALWFGRGVEKVVSAVSLPSSFWWWVVGALVAIFVIVLLWKNRTTVLTPFGQVRKKIRWGWVFGLAALGGLVFLSYNFEAAVEERLKDYLRDKDIGGLPILARSDPVSPEATLAMIAECESGGRHVDDEGNLVVNAESGALGKYQILPSLHEEKAKELGLDIRTEEGNERYAQVLFDKFGTAPWVASRHCWADKVVAPYAKTFSGVTLSSGVMRVGRNWSEWVRVPPGQELYIERISQFAYEMEIQNGDVFEYPRDFRGHHRLPLLQRARFRVTDEEAEELSIWLRFSEHQR